LKSEWGARRFRHFSGAVGDVAAVAQAPWCFWGDCDKHFAAGAFYNACLPLPSRAVPPASAAATAAAADGGAAGIEVVGTGFSDTTAITHGIEVDSGSEAVVNFGIEVVASGSANSYGIEVVDQGSAR